MYQPQALASPPGSVAARLAGLAYDKQLTIYAGAGISAAPPTSLPGAASLANRLWERLTPLIELDSAVDRWDLLSVADAVAAHPAGVELLRGTILEVADMTGAPPNYAHEVIALLLCEGVASVLEMNYDNCIERAAQPEIPAVARTPEDLLHGSKNALLKVHGCASLPPTMLVTTADLAGVDFWADAIVRANLSQDHFLFIGIGSVADYVRDSLKSVIEEVGSGHLTLVDPILEKWDSVPELDWQTLLPDLPSDQRVESPADEFCDALLRAYVLRLCQNLNATTAGLSEDHPQRAGVKQLLGAFYATDGVSVMRWLRHVSWGYEPGMSVASATVTIQGLVALSGLLGSLWSAEFPRNEVIQCRPLEASNCGESFGVMPLLAGHGKGGSALASEAERRVALARRRGDLAPESPVLIVADGHVGSLGPTELEVARNYNLDDVIKTAEPYLENLAFDLISASSPGHLIDGPAAGRVVFVRAANLGEAS